MNTNIACPDCGAPLQIVLDGQRSVDWFVAKRGRVEKRLESRPFAACTGCEFCVDLTTANPKLLTHHAA